MDKRTTPGMQVFTLSRPAYREVFITAVPVAGEPAEMTFNRIAGALRDSGARIVSLEVFGLSGSTTDPVQMLSDVFGGVSWPVTWAGSTDAVRHAIGGVQVWAVAGVPVAPLELDGRLVGSVFEDDCAQYCRLGNLRPADPSRARGEQARDVLEQMKTALRTAAMEFTHVVRTWFYNDDILRWYGDFNRVRGTFFNEQRVADRLVPASTAVGLDHATASGNALLSGLLAVKAKDQRVRARTVPSPLQCPAPEYGSSFSRAVELVMPDWRRLLISGTASIAPEGHSLHSGDLDAQIGHTMDVVQAILESRGMGWSDVLRAVGHFKRAADASAFSRHCAGTPAASLPVVLMQSEICRDELLFELELDAATTA